MTRDTGGTREPGRRWDPGTGTQGGTGTQVGIELNKHFAELCMMKLMMQIDFGYRTLDTSKKNI